MSNRKIKFELMKKSSECYYCNQLVYVYDNIPNGLKPKNEATVEHLYAKFESKRNNSNIKEKYVLACWQCNHNVGIKKYMSFLKSKKIKKIKIKSKISIEFLRESPMYCKWVLCESS